MLLLWFFTWGSGIAHACLMNDAHTDGVSAHHAAYAVHDAGGAEAAPHSVDCPRISALSEAIGQKGGVRLPDLDMDAAVVSGWQVLAVPVHLRPAPQREWQSVTAPLPLFIRFLRLTL